MDLQLTLLVIISLLAQAGFFVAFLLRAPQVDLNKQQHSCATKPTYKYTLTAISLVVVSISICYAIFTFHLACTDLSLSFKDTYDPDNLYHAWTIVQWTFLVYDFGPSLLLQSF